MNYEFKCSDKLNNIMSLVENKTYDPQNLHIMTAGFPCQPFSAKQVTLKV